MTSRLWRQIEEVYIESRSYPPSSRERFIAAACGDDDRLRREVQALADAADADGHRLDAPFVESALSAMTRVMDAGRKVGRYELRERLGAGGMGEVYSAWDPVLEREVALKLLFPDRAAASPSSLLREARAAARVAHPDVCTVHEIGEHEGQAFIVTELVRGTTLADTLEHGAFAPDRAARIALALSAAVAHAHACGILHRDLKPRNVMLTSTGGVKVLDFGLARHVKTDGGPHDGLSGVSEPTEPVTPGTLAYMAPELLRGEPATAASDVWSLGVILHEMLAGARPFDHQAPLELTSAILRDDPPPLAHAVDPALRAIVGRALHKDDSQRYRDAASLASDLEAFVGRLPGATVPVSRLASPPTAKRLSPRLRRYAPPLALTVALSAAVGHTTTPAPRQIMGISAAADVALLPFGLPQTSAERSYVGIAVPDLIGLELASHGNGIDVRRASGDQGPLSGPAAVPALAQALHVKHVFGGTLIPIATGYRLSLALYEDDAREKWSKDYAIETPHLQSMVRSIASDVARAIGKRLPMTIDTRPHATTTDAYDGFLKGQAALVRHSRGGLEQAVREFERVLQLDPTYAPAYAGLALACARAYFATPSNEMNLWSKRARHNAMLAVRLAPELADAHLALAAVYRYNESDWNAAIEESLRALDLDSRLDLAHYTLSVAFYHLGLFDLSDSAARAGLARNPSSRYESFLHRGRAAFYGGDPAKARVLLEEGRVPEGTPVSWVLAEAYYYTGDRGLAIDAMQKLLNSRSGSDQGRARASLAAFAAAEGHRDVADRYLAAFNAQSPADHHRAYRVGAALAQLGRPVEAMRWLRLAADTGFPCYGWFANDRMLASLHGQPDYEALLARLRAQRDALYDRYRMLYAP